MREFFRPGYANWIPALQDVKDKLESGGRVADVGCGKEASTLLMAKAHPKSQFFGFDYHDKSIEAARESAKKEGVSDRVSFEVSKTKEYPGKDCDFVAVFDCLHDMGDPIRAAAHVRQSLAKDGTSMIVEPFANDQLKDNLNPVGRVYYSFSTLLCTLARVSRKLGFAWVHRPASRASRCRHQSWIHAFPSSYGNSVQHRLRSSTVVERLQSR